MLYDIPYILLSVFIVLLIISIVWIILSLKKYFQLKSKLLEQEIEHRELELSNKNKVVEYTNSILQLVREMVGEIAVLKFRTFQDTHKMDGEEIKITKSNVETLVRDIAETSNKSLNQDNFSFDDTFFTKEFYENYIIETSIIIVKELLHKAIDEIDEYF